MAIYIKAEAGFHDRINCPVSLRIDKEYKVMNYNCLKDVITGREYFLDVKEEEDQYLLEWIIDYLPAKSEVRYLLSERSSKESPVMKALLKDRKIDIYSMDDFVTAYNFGKETAKPYLGPIKGEFGDSVTRIDFNTKEHPHHRSIWFSHGDVNSVDFWNEPEGKHGRILNKSICEIRNTNVYSSFKAHNVWTDYNFLPMLEDVTFIKLYNTPKGYTLMDVCLTLKASFESIALGATKEAGPIAIRVNDEMMVKRTGKITNGYAGINEDEIWMKRAPWCDYSGVINSRSQGIAIFDDPGNYGYPSYWHSRNYGLMAPNNYYIPGKQILNKSEEISFSYRIAVHMGDASSAAIGERFHDYINPPKTEMVKY